MKLLSTLVRSAFFSFVLFACVRTAYAADVVTTGSSETSTGLTNPLNNINSLPDFMNAILDAVVQLGSIVLVFAIVYVGFKFVTAQGNEEEIRSARTALMWVVIGGLVLLGAKTVGLVITNTVQQL